MNTRLEASTGPQVAPPRRGNVVRSFTSGPPRPNNRDMARVLVVEDEPSIVTVVRYHLENAGFDGLFASDASHGWRLMVSDVPDVAVVDIGLPTDDGWGLLEKMRGDDRFKDVPAIVLTGRSASEVGQRIADLKCEYMGKPFAATALLSRISHLIDGSSRQPDGVAPRSDSIRVELVSIGVVLLLDGYRIEGQVYLPPELGRFSDAWESVMRDHRHFVPVTDARVTTPDGSHAIAGPAFIEVRKEDVRAVFPMDVFPG